MTVPLPNPRKPLARSWRSGTGSPGSLACLLAALLVPLFGGCASRPGPEAPGDSPASAAEASDGFADEEGGDAYGFEDDDLSSEDLDEDELASAERAFEDAASELDATLGGAVQLSDDGCVDACSALASMSRSAERLCSLDPGERCEKAEARVQDAEARVLGACEACE